VGSAVLDHIPARTGCYIGSPSIARLDEQTLLASHDIFGLGSSWDRSEVFRSHDNGATWEHVCSLQGQWWSTLFLHHGGVYMIGTSKEWGDVVIRRSEDRGSTWTTPSDPACGLLLTGARYHCAPVPIIQHNGRLWRAMEDAGSHGRDFSAFVMSIAEDADLLRADAWKSSDRLHQDRSLLGGRLMEWAEGNVVVDRQGQLVDVLRVFAWTLDEEKVALMHVDEEGTAVRLDPDQDLVTMPGGGKKYTIRWDPLTQRYWSFTNHVPEPQKAAIGIRARNTLCLIESSDLRQWRVAQVLLHHPDDRGYAFQYADWMFDGDDILFVSRTAAADEEGGAHTYHDANYLTFHRLVGFRQSSAARPASASHGTHRQLVYGRAWPRRTAPRDDRHR
jgi:hypothetical protein